jgi:uncharacterized protein (TIGR01244 family)
MADDPDDIVAWQRLGPKVTTSGRLTPADPGRLAGIGVRRVINLALADSPGALVGEADLMAAASLDYTHIPVPFDAPDEEHFAAFREAMATSDAPVHVHCIMNWRVSAFFYRYHRDHLGMDEGAARALMAAQWVPETNDNKDAPTWARFIREED